MLVSRTPVETWGSGFTWLVRSGISGFHRNTVYPVKHGGQDWPDRLDQGFPDSPGTSYPPNHVDARADDQNVGKGVFCSIALASRRPRWSPTTVWSRGKGRHPVFDALSVENCGWTACPFGGWNVRSNNARTVVPQHFDWMFGIIQGSWKPCPSWLDFGPNTSIDSFFQSFTEHVTLHTWWLTCGVLVFTEHTTFWMTPHTKTLNRSLNRGVQRFDVE